MRILIAFLLALVPATARGEIDVPAIARGVAAVAADLGEARLGVGVLDLRSGQAFEFAGDDRFPMQGVAALALGVVVMKQVDAGRLALDRPVTVTRRDLAMAFSPIAASFRNADRVIGLGDLLHQTVALGDNTASDVMLRLAGGPRAVQASLVASGIDGIRVDRYIRELAPGTVGVMPYGVGSPIVEGEWLQEWRAVSEPQQRAAIRHHVDVDPRDTATPRASVVFLARLWRGELLSVASTARLVAAMTATPAGAMRLKAGWPAGARFAHQAGTGLDVVGINAATNDIGVVTLPNGATLAIAVYLAGSRADLAAREKIHARIARLVADACR